MRTASMECAPHGIRVNAVLPGPIETRMMRNIEESRSPGAPEKARAALVNAARMKRYGTPEEVANVMLFLASDEASLLHRWRLIGRRRAVGVLSLRLHWPRLGL